MGGFTVHGNLRGSARHLCCVHVSKKGIWLRFLQEQEGDLMKSWPSWEFSSTLIDYHHLGPNERKLSSTLTKNLSTFKVDEMRMRVNESAWEFQAKREGEFELSLSFGQDLKGQRSAQVRIRTWTEHCLNTSAPSFLLPVRIANFSRLVIVQPPCDRLARRAGAVSWRNHDYHYFPWVET